MTEYTPLKPKVNRALREIYDFLGRSGYRFFTLPHAAKFPPPAGWNSTFYTDSAPIWLTAEQVVARLSINNIALDSPPGCFVLDLDDKTDGVRRMRQAVP